MSTGRPKVLWVTKGLSRGGAETLMLELSRQTALGEYEIHVAAALSKNNEMRSEFERHEVPVHDLGGTRTIDPAWIVGLARLMNAEPFRILHAHSPLPASLIRLLATANRSDAALVTTEHNGRNDYMLPTRYLNDLTMWRDDVRIAVSAATAASFSKEASVIYHGRDLPEADTASFASVQRRELAVLPTDRVIVTIANLRREKTLHFLLYAMQVLQRRLVADSAAGRRAKLLIVGDGVDRERLTGLVRNLGLESAVTFLGQRDDAWKFLALADVFSLSSRIEGLPVAAMEALMMGVPVVATDVGGLCELVKQGSNGYLVPEGDYEGLARRLYDVLFDDRRRARLAAAARVSASQFSPRRAAEQYAAIYARLVADREGRPKQRYRSRIA